MDEGHGQNERHRSDSSITNRRKLSDELCLPIPNTTRSKCDSVEGHISHRFKDIVKLVMKRVWYLDDKAYVRFKTELERNKELKATYEAKRQERWLYKKSRKLRKTINETGQPPEGYRKLERRETQNRDKNNDPNS